MQDRFKFSVWDKEQNCYKYGLTVFDYMRGMVDRERYILEQCTGLKDKNGKLIYEGDIVAKIDINGFGYPRTRICRVYWKEDWLGWAIETEYGDVYALGDYGSDNFEIIGNIHENGDLLNDR